MLLCCCCWCVCCNVVVGVVPGVVAVGGRVLVGVLVAMLV